MIELLLDGNVWCARQVNLDIMEGICGFGETQAEALRAFAINLENAGGEL